jgi:hypothetical protein
MRYHRRRQWSLDLAQVVPENLFCPVCFEQYTAPVALPRMLGCGHTFCEPCLRKMLAPLLANKGGKV